MNTRYKLFVTALFVWLFLAPTILLGQALYSAPYADKIPLWQMDFEDYLNQYRLQWHLPIRTNNRQSLENVELTRIGKFGLMRAARPGIPAHHHTGTDFKRPSDNYVDEPIFPAAKGTVVSLRDDGPYAQIIIQHTLEDSTILWTVYEHVAGIQTKLHEHVDPFHPIARFMTREELNKYGWQFDHVHFEVMRAHPIPRRPDKRRPYLRYGTHCLVCYTQKGLDEKYFDPLEFLSSKWEVFAAD